MPLVCAQYSDCVKARADSDGLPLRQVILALLRHYADGRVTLRARITARTV